MKASEFPHKQTYKKPEQARQPVSEAARAPVKKSGKPESHVAPFGVDDAQGHVMRRIHAAHPYLISKLQNWD